MRPSDASAPEQEDLVVEIEKLCDRLAAARASIGKVIFGHTHVVDLSLTTLLSGGHALLIGVPGLGKTRLVETMGLVLGLEDSRI